MNDVDLLADAITREPHNTIVQAMLIDELMDVRGMLRSEADAHVLRIAACAKTALVVLEAAALLQPGLVSTRYIHSVLRRRFRLSREQMATLVLVSETQDEEHVGSMSVRMVSHTEHFTITVGAQWVVQMWNAEKLRRAAVNARRRARYRETH